MTGISVPAFLSRAHLHSARASVGGQLEGGLAAGAQTVACIPTVNLLQLVDGAALHVGDTENAPRSGREIAQDANAASLRSRWLVIVAALSSQNASRLSPSCSPWRRRRRACALHVEKIREHVHVPDKKSQAMTRPARGLAPDWLHVTGRGERKVATGFGWTIFEEPFPGGSARPTGFCGSRSRVDRLR